MPRVVHFEIHVENPERVIRFYQGLFNWHFQKWNGPIDYWTINTGDAEPGINGGLVRRHGAGPSAAQAVNAYVCTVQVPVLDDYIAEAGVHGGVIVVPKMPIPGIGWLVYAKDPEGNLFGMIQHDRAAK